MVGRGPRRAERPPGKLLRDLQGTITRAAGLETQPTPPSLCVVSPTRYRPPTMLSLTR